VIDWIKGKGGGVSFVVLMIFEFIIFLIGCDLGLS